MVHPRWFQGIKSPCSFFVTEILSHAVFCRFYATWLYVPPIIFRLQQKYANGGNDVESIPSISSIPSNIQYHWCTIRAIRGMGMEMMVNIYMNPSIPSIPWLHPIRARRHGTRQPWNGGTWSYKLEPTTNGDQRFMNPTNPMKAPWKTTSRIANSKIYRNLALKTEKFMAYWWLMQHLCTSQNVVIRPTWLHRQTLLPLCTVFFSTRPCWESEKGTSRETSLEFLSKRAARYCRQTSLDF